MDILIKGMELPKTENDNFMVIVTPTGVIDVVENGNGFMIQKKYEAIELPSHGDLIDRDKLYKDTEGTSFVELCDALYDAPVIVEATE